MKLPLRTVLTHFMREKIADDGIVHDGNFQWVLYSNQWQVPWTPLNPKLCKPLASGVDSDSVSETSEKNKRKRFHACGIKDN